MVLPRSMLVEPARSEVLMATLDRLESAWLAPAPPAGAYPLHTVAVVQMVPVSLGKVMVLLEPEVLESSVVLKALEELLMTIVPAVVEAVPRVRLEPATVSVPVRLVELEIVWPLIAPEVIVPEILRSPDCWLVGDSSAIVPELSLIVIVRAAPGVPVKRK